ALLIGVSRTTAAEFSFFLAIPTMFGASLLKAVKFFLEGNTLIFTEISALIVGMAVAFVVSLAVIRFLMSFVKKHDFKIFGWYRIALGVVVLAVFLLV
ncbi:MAG: undecaprenyl-diphosphate phosphatase, partial [Clostridia bacterium]|nr:undecaprenyl-diphosphate phosphatase [Clostridia bacterium]